eukprot:SAG25_NODE_313_length_9986_cov_6.931324_7_plen_196_part_00
MPFGTRRSPSGLFLLPGEPEPEPEPAVRRRHTLLDHGGVRLGREVILSRAELAVVGRSKALCRRARSFVAGWADGTSPSWINEFCATDQAGLQAWAVMTDARRAEKLREMQGQLRRGRQILLGDEEEQDQGEGFAGWPRLEERGVAALCLALLAGAVAKDAGCVVGGFVVEDPAHRLLQRLASARGTAESAEPTR